MKNINFENKVVLDFGGNFRSLRNLLNNNLVNATNYTCVDVNEHSINLGKESNPEATWIHYNRYNPVYNPNGSKNTFPQLNAKYDIIFSYSVFSHTTYEELLVFIEYFKTKLNKGGSMYLSVLIHGNPILQWFYKTRIEQYNECDNILTEPDEYLYLVNNKIQKNVPHSCKHFLTIYNKQFVSTLGLIESLGLPQTFLKISYK